MNGWLAFRLRQIKQLLPARPLHTSRFSLKETEFVPRGTFRVPPNNPFTWFPGHMVTGLRVLAATIADVDLIIETRDARIPLSSRNPYLEDVCANKRRLVLYNKRDLASLSRKQQDVFSGSRVADYLAHFGMAYSSERYSHVHEYS
jgi:hypothetical protein